MEEMEAWVQAHRVDFTAFLCSGGIDRFEVKMVERNLGPKGGWGVEPTGLVCLAQMSHPLCLVCGPRALPVEKMLVFMLCRCG
jgi:hypothetical protein